jgi:hypothetical protein
MKESLPQIHVVVRSGWTAGRTLFELPSEPWPRFGATLTSNDGGRGAFVVGTLCCYGSSPGEPARFRRDIGQCVFPKCCLEDLRWSPTAGRYRRAAAAAWKPGAIGRAFLSGGGSPWTGHDPSPLVEVVEGNVHVWSDGALGRGPPSESPIVFTSEQFEKAVRRAAADLEGFVFPPVRVARDACSASGAQNLGETSVVSRCQRPRMMPRLGRCSIGIGPVSVICAVSCPAELPCASGRERRPLWIVRVAAGRDCPDRSVVDESVAGRAALRTP